jgi:predicted kinase
MICGKVGAGKTTYARGLAEDRRALLLSLDEWMLHLYDEHMPREVFDARIDLCMELMLRLTERLVPLGNDVVLDCGFWRRRRRDEVRARIQASGGQPILHYLDVPAEERWRRLVARGAEQAAYKIDADMFELFEGWFEPPTEDEKPVRWERSTWAGLS